ncbi:MAG TPA: hypothetical protein VES95_12500 [Dermatophilaceae bacterium]|nr:hypothetical protein [Dermatophilaceae bacterium]
MTTATRGEWVPALLSAVGRHGWWVLRWVWTWLRSHPRLALAWAVPAVVLGAVRGEPVWAWLVAGLALPVALAGWAWRWPAGYERLVAGPSRRRGWRRHLRRHWTVLAEACGWTRPVHRTRRLLDGTVQRTTTQVAPRLRRVRACGSTVTLVVRARAGQTLDHLEAGVPALAATMDALSWRCTAHRGSTSTLLVELVMHDALRGARHGTPPASCLADPPGHGLPLGRRDVGGT